MKVATLTALCYGALLAPLATIAQESAPAAYELAFVSLDGQREPLGRLPGTVYAPRLSHDGTRVAFDDQGANGSTVFVAAVRQLGARRALPLVGGKSNAFPLWSADDERVLFIAPQGEEQALFWQLADGSGHEERLAIPARAPESWTPDRRMLNFITLTEGDYAIATWNPATRAATPLLQREGSLQHSSHYSRDGRWLVYASNETGRFEVWVEPIPMTGVRHQITHDGGEHPLWSHDGTKIFFDRAASLYSVGVTTSGGFKTGDVQALPIKGFAQLANYRRQFDIAPDADRFLMLFPAN